MQCAGKPLLIAAHIVVIFGDNPAYLEEKGLRSALWRHNEPLRQGRQLLPDAPEEPLLRLLLKAQALSSLILYQLQPPRTDDLVLVFTDRT